MQASKKMKRGEKQLVQSENLDRFAGSSDEEDEEKPMAPPAPASAVLNSSSDVDGEYDDDNNNDDDDDNDDEFMNGDKNLDNEKRNVGNDENDDLSSVEGEELDAASKMANVMSRILGTETKGNNKKDALSSSVVLAKTVTPLQKLQQKEKEQQKAMKEKRQANRERNLTALHLPLSIATTNNIEADGQLSVAKELEQERFHRRVATRGVVALFNAITQHQRNNTTDVGNLCIMNIFVFLKDVCSRHCQHKKRCSHLINLLLLLPSLIFISSLSDASLQNDDSNVSSKKKEISKLTKHGFLDKIKAAAKTKGSDEQKETEISKRGNNLTDNEGKNRSSWGALQDDYMLNSKKVS
jgi:hypothetical protein